MPRYNMPNNGPWFNCAVGPNGYVAIAGSSSSSTTRAATSPDGQTWTARVLSVSAGWGGYYRAFCYDPVNEAFVAIDVRTSNVVKKIAYSTDDGVTWTVGDMPTDSGTNVLWVSCAANAAGRIVAVGRSNRLSPAQYVASHSDDGGATWSAPVSIANADSTLGGICFGDSYFFTVDGSDSDRYFYSSDGGVTWTEDALPETHFWLNPVWNGSVFFVATDDSSGKYAVSGDLSSWTVYTATGGFGAHWQASAARPDGLIASVNAFGNDFTQIGLFSGNGSSSQIVDLSDDPSYLDWYGLVAMLDGSCFLALSAAGAGYALIFCPAVVEGAVNRYFLMFP